MANQIADTRQVAATAARLRLATARLHRRLRRETDGEQTASAIAALATIQRLGAVSLGELAEAEGIYRPSMTVLTAGLEANGLVRRESDPNDGRLVRVSLTNLGRSALARSRTLRTAYLARRLRGLDRADLEVLDRAAGIMERLTAEP